MTLRFDQATTAGDVILAALTSRLSLTCAAIGIVSLLVVAFTARAMVRIGKAAPVRVRRPAWKDESGVATMEFALLCPLLLMFSLMLAQSTMVMGGNIFVHYSAFAAARTAMVQIPFDYADDEPNAVTPSKGSSKYDAIHQAAVFALLPVGGRDAGGGEYDSGQLVSGMTTFYSAYGATPPPWINEYLAERLAHVSTNTEVRLYRAYPINETQVEFEQIESSQLLEPRDAVTVEVVHGLYLAVPYASWAFADSTTGETGIGGADARRTMTLRASCTLTLEGVTDVMPEEPELPRVPL